MFITKSIIRGEKTTLSWEIDGQLGDGNIFFTAKRDYSLTGDRIIDILCASQYDSSANKTTITAQIATEDTQNIIYNVLVYDVTLIDSQAEETVLIRGNLNIKFDARTPYDQTPVDPEKYIPVKLSDFQDGEYIKAKEVNGTIEFIGYTSLRNGLFDIDIDGNLMPKEQVDFDDLYELDSNGDIMPRENI